MYLNKVTITDSKEVLTDSDLQSSTTHENHTTTPEPFAVPVEFSMKGTSIFQDEDDSRFVAEDEIVAPNENLQSERSPVDESIETVPPENTKTSNDGNISQIFSFGSFDQFASTLEELANSTIALLSGANSRNDDDSFSTIHTDQSSFALDDEADFNKRIAMDKDYDDESLIQGEISEELNQSFESFESFVLNAVFELIDPPADPEFVEEVYDSDHDDEDDEDDEESEGDADQASSDESALDIIDEGDEEEEEGTCNEDCNEETRLAQPRRTLDDVQDQNGTPIDLSDIGKLINLSENTTAESVIEIIQPIVIYIEHVRDENLTESFTVTASFTKQIQGDTEDLALCEVQGNLSSKTSNDRICSPDTNEDLSVNEEYACDIYPADFSDTRLGSQLLETLTTQFRSEKCDLNFTGTDLDLTMRMEQVAMSPSISTGCRTIEETQSLGQVPADISDIDIKILKLTDNHTAWSESEIINQSIENEVATNTEFSLFMTPFIVSEKAAGEEENPSNSDDTYHYDTLTLENLGSGDIFVGHDDNAVFISGLINEVQISEASVESEHTLHHVNKILLSTHLETVDSREYITSVMSYDTVIHTDNMDEIEVIQAASVISP